MLTRDGQVRWFRDETAIFPGEDGRPLYLCGVMLDITERVQLESELERAQRQLSRVQAARQSELAQELEAVVGCYLSALRDHPARIRRLATDAAQGHVSALATILAELDLVAQQVLDIITTMRERVVELRADSCAIQHLTPRELAVLRLLVRGKNNREVAQELGVSVKTVEKHIGKLYAKLGVQSRAEAVVWAAHQGLV